LTILLQSFSLPPDRSDTARVCAAMSQVRDYAVEGGGTAPLNLNTSPRRPDHIDLEAQSPMSPYQYPEGQRKPQSPTESLRLRKPMRSNTVKTYRPERRGQNSQPGQEPGIDTKATQPHPSSKTPSLYQECRITVVDFSEEDIQFQHLNNRTLEACMEKGRPLWGTLFV